MVGAKGSRMKRLLKRTSEHHRPSRLAAAVAIGMLAGLVPKANLMAVLLYAALVLLPIHTLLGLMVSAVVSCATAYCDSITHAIGIGLLEQQALRPLWFMLDNAAILPWLSLHNTVVLGNFVVGFVLLGPTYLISLRVFERVMWGMRPSKPEYANAPREIIIRPSETRPVAATASMEEEIDFEPVREVMPIINNWHMGSAARVRGRMESVAVDRQSRPLSATGSSSKSPAATNPEPFVRRSDHREASPPAHPPEIANSLDVAQSASEVLAWVDELLDECLAERGLPLLAEGISEVSRDLWFNAPAGHAPAPEFDPAGVDAASDQQWLMETTIEIVRWADGSQPPEQVSEQVSIDNPLPPDPAPISTSTSLSASASTSACDSPKAASSIAPPTELEPVIHTMPRRDVNEQKLTTGFQQLVLADMRSGSAAEHSEDSIEPQRGECLGYLLGHLRQTRDGRSS